VYLTTVSPIKCCFLWYDAVYTVRRCTRNFALEADGRNLYSHRRHSPNS
jgi:hypothetical protein